MRLWLPSLEACITACAEYNAAYQWNERAGVAAGGLCRSVAVIKEGELPVNNMMILDGC
jgi:hypothetical protein